jgi:predicted NBD/HSP70 family sugar kinase
MHDRKRGTVRDLRRDNRAALLWSLYLGRRTRPELSAATGLSPATVTNVIRELIGEGVVIETGLTGSDGGRPRTVLGMNPGYGYVIGVDIGETRTRVELFDLTMTGLARADYPLDRAAARDADVVVEQIGAGLDQVLAGSGTDPGAVLGVGVGVPGIIERGPEVLVHGQAYGWDAVPLERLLRARTGLPLLFDNGAKTMGQAELWFGAGRGARNAVIMLIGSGVGASLISGGATYQGATSSAAELGHVPVVVGGRTCRCGSAGCLEAYAGATSILERYGQVAAAGDQELALAELIAAAATSARAAALLDETAGYLGAGIGAVINLFNPERVIIGGWAGLLLGERLLPAIRESARRHSLRQLHAAATIGLGELGPGAVALGAATLPVESFLNGRRLHWRQYPLASSQSPTAPQECGQARP